MLTNAPDDGGSLNHSRDQSLDRGMSEHQGHPQRPHERTELCTEHLSPIVGHTNTLEICEAELQLFWLGLNNLARTVGTQALAVKIIKGLYDTSPETALSPTELQELELRGLSDASLRDTFWLRSALHLTALHLQYEYTAEVPLDDQLHALAIAFPYDRVNDARFLEYQFPRGIAPLEPAIRKLLLRSDDPVSDGEMGSGPASERSFPESSDQDK